MILCDTCTILWLLGKAERLSATARRTLDSADVPLLVSVISWMEASGKASRGRLPLPIEKMRALVRRVGVQELPVTGDIAERMERLPLHHLDPFDRALVAQAQLLGAAILTPDGDIARYDVEVIW